MKRTPLIIQTLVVLLCINPAMGRAEIVVSGGETVESSPPRFFPVAGARAGNPTGKVTYGKRKTMRSDSGAMADGFFRIDRSNLVRAHGPLVIRVPSVAQEPTASLQRVIYGAGREIPASAPMASTAALTSSGTAWRGGSPLATGASAPILSLFDGQADALQPSFRDALSGGKPTHAIAAIMPHSWPIAQNEKQRLSSNYGFRASPFDSHTQFHGGIDIASPIGTPVQASASGTVSKVGTESGYGKTIIITHPDGSESRYSHLNTDQVSEGQAVAVGQTIGTVGASGHATGPHLDYRLAKDGVSMDPLKVLRAAPAMGEVARNTVARPLVATPPHREKVIMVR